MYVKILNNKVEKYPYNLADLEEDFPNTSFPSNITSSTLEGFGVYKVIETSPPQLEVHEELIENTPILTQEGWQQQWKVSPLSEEAFAFKKDFKARTVREERNARLRDSDWSLMVDSPLTEEDKSKFKVYRQALRDISLQPEFPWVVTWPTL